MAGAGGELGQGFGKVRFHPTPSFRPPHTVIPAQSLPSCPDTGAGIHRDGRGGLSHFHLSYVA